MNEKFIDLHVHTNFSDGFDDIPMAMKKARENNVGVISFTEHYNLASFYIAREYAGNIDVIPGIEIGADMSSFSDGKKHICHILGYYVSDSICALLDEYEMDRHECVLKTLELLKKQRIDLSMEQVEYIARDKKSIGRYDIALALSYYNYVRTPQEAYGRYLDYRGKSYVQRNKLSPTELIIKISEYGGVPVLAHPKSLRLNTELERKFIEELVNAGLKGIEVYNPFNSPEKREYYNEFCKLYNLIPTVGSDYHGGKRKPEVLIGLGINNNLCISDMEIVKRLKKEK